MDYPITNTELQQLCTYLTTQSYIYYPISTSFFKDLFSTGCRPNELLQVSRWAYITPSQILLTPLKGNTTRTFTEFDLSQNLIYAIINQIKPYQGLSLRQLTSVLKKILPVPQVKTNNKSAIDYMFRYNFVKFLMNVGYTGAQVQAIMGWNTAYIYTNYYMRGIATSTQLPPIAADTIIDFDGSFVVDNSNNYIN